MSTKILDKRSKKKIRIRKKISGTAERPRLVVFRSNSQIYTQIIDDASDKTLVAASSLSKEIAEDIKSAKDKTAASELVGGLIAKLAKEAGVTCVVFDRGGYNYHGRVKAVAEGARKGGLKI